MDFQKVNSSISNQCIAESQEVFKDCWASEMQGVIQIVKN